MGVYTKSVTLSEIVAVTYQAVLFSKIHIRSLSPKGTFVDPSEPFHKKTGNKKTRPKKDPKKSTVRFIFLEKFFRI